MTSVTYIDVFNHNFSGMFRGMDTTDLYLLDGDDVVTIFNTYVTADGGTGNDSITIIGEASGHLYGGDGQDKLMGGLYADILDGGAGNDVLAGNGNDDQLYGGQGSDFLVGGDDNDELYGGHGVDVLSGDAGNDYLFGGFDADTLDGGAGLDRMSGGDGNDVYNVTDIGDKVLEHADEGHDTVLAKIDWTLSANVEDLFLDGKASIDGTGNTLANRIEGNAAANSLKGAGGNDVLVGEAGDDVLDGGVGSDYLYGGANKDAFVFNTALSVSTNVDTIADFWVADDTIRIDDAIFKSIAKTGVLLSGYLRVNNTGLAQDANDHIIYEKDTGEVYYDSNGTGAGGSILFAKIGVGLALTNADFLVI